MHRPARRLAAAALLLAGTAAAQTPTPTAPGFAVTAFATGLDFPLGMVELDDGSLLVATADPPAGGGSYFASPGRLLRLHDADGDGVADGPGTVVASGLPGALTSLERRGDLLFVTSAASPGVEILRLSGAGAATTAAAAAGFGLSFPSFPRPDAADGTPRADRRWEHRTNALAAAPVAGDPASTDLYFNVGSAVDARASDPSLGEVPSFVSGGVATPIAADAVHRVRVTDGGVAGVTVSAPTRVAAGLRNAAGLAVHPVTGDLFLQDNGVDGSQPGGRGEALAADELHRIAAADLFDADVEDFGFGRSYVDYRTGQTVGVGGLDPLIAFTSVLGPGEAIGDTPENEGAVEIAFAPDSFGAGYDEGVFVAFYGQANQGGRSNRENPLVFADASGDPRVAGDPGFTHFLGVDEQSLGHPSGLLSTGDALYLSDLNTGGGLAASGGGAIYRIAVPEPGSAAALLGGLFLLGRRCCEGTGQTR